MLETKNSMYSFAGCWLYAENTNLTWKKKIDREILSLRLSGDMSRIFNEYTGDSKCSLGRQKAVGPLIVGLPVAIFVMPLILCIVLLIAKKKQD